MEFKVGIIVPTNELKTFLDMFLPSIEHLDDIKYMAQFQIIFQPPWTKDLIHAVKNTFESAGWTFLYDFLPEQKQPVNILNLRSLAAELDTSVDIYLSLDDDMRFSSGTATVKKSSGQRYFEAIEYMQKFERCGSLDCRGFFGGKQQGQRVCPVWYWCYTMGTGQFFRNFTRIDNFALTPPEARHLAGIPDEALNSVVRIERGYFHALLRNNVTYHKTGPADIMDVVSDDHWLSRKVSQSNIIKWIRERYGCPNWDNEPRVKKCPVPYGLYLKNGGVDFLNNKEVINDLTIEF